MTPVPAHLLAQLQRSQAPEAAPQSEQGTHAGGAEQAGGIAGAKAAKPSPSEIDPSFEGEASDTSYIPDEEVSGPITASKARISQKGLPQKLGRYVLTHRLGVGGMAEVFKATRDGVAGFQKTVVVKRILPHLAVDDRFVDMFFREAKVAANLSHPNIIQIHELGEDDGTYFIVMEYLRGLSLFQLARRAWRAKRSLPMELAVYAVADAALGLSYAWDAEDEDGRPMRLIHRDISPDNLIMTSQAVTKVVDFGIAKAANTDNLTKTGEMKGKIPFMPKELLEPGGELDHRSDLYALGVTLFWLLTGQRPFRGETDLQVMQAIVAGNPQRPTALNRSIPNALAEITLSLLGRDKDMRPSSGHVVANDLLGLVSAQRDQVAAFVREMMLEEPLRPGEQPTTGGFLPAVPITDTLAAAQLMKPSPEALGFDVDLATLGSAPRLDFEAALPSSVTRSAEGASSSSEQPDGSAGLPAEDDGGVWAGESAAATDDDDPPALGGRRLPMLLGAAAALALVGVAGVAAFGGDDEPLEPPPATSAPSGGASGDTAEPGPAADGPGAAAAPTGEPAGPASTAPDDAAPATAVSANAVPANAVPASPEPAEDVNRPAEISPGPRAPPSRARSRPPKRSAPALVTLAASGPGFIKWVDAKGKTLGKGNAKLSVPSSTRSLFALDTRSGARSPAAVKGDKVSYDAIPEGTLVLRAFPFADMVSLGGRKLGPAPLKPQKLKVGSYTVVVEKGGKKITEKVTIEAGRSVVVKANFAKD